MLRHGLVRDGARRRTPGPPFQPGRSAFPRGRRSRARGHGRARGAGAGAATSGAGAGSAASSTAGACVRTNGSGNASGGTAVSDPRVRRLGSARSDDRVIGGKTAGASSSGRRGGSGGRSAGARVANGRAARRARRRPLGRTREKTSAASRVAYLRFRRRRGRRFVPGRLGVERLLQALDEHRLEAFGVQVALLELLAEHRDGHRARFGHDTRLSFSCGRATTSAGGLDVARAFFASGSRLRGSCWRPGARPVRPAVRPVLFAQKRP